MLLCLKCFGRMDLVNFSPCVMDKKSIRAHADIKL